MIEAVTIVTARVVDFLFERLCTTAHYNININTRYLVNQYLVDHYVIRLCTYYEYCYQ